jgi:serine/threonine-protein kinase
VSDAAKYDGVTLSPDDRFAAVSIISDQGGTWDIWVIDLERGLRTRFTFDPADDTDPVWAHDGRSLYFTSDREGESAVYQKTIGSSEAPHKVFDIGKGVRLWDCDADARTVIYSSAGDATGYDLWAGDLTGETEPRLLHRSVEQDVMGRLSPDGKWLTFSTAESGQPQVYVAPWPEMVPITQVSTTTGTWSGWTRDGAELIYHEVAGRLMAVSMTPTADGIGIGPPAPLFEFEAPFIETVHWAITADGERFLTVNAFNMQAPGVCNIVMDWPGLIENR